SNIEMAHDINIVDESSANSSSPLVKNNYRIIPNPMGIYSEADSSLFIYVELYNLVYNPNSADSFSLSFSIYDADGNMFRDFDPKMIEKPGETSIITNVIDFHDWKAGRYELKVAAFDLSFDQVTEVSRQFVIYPKSAQLSDVIATTVISPIDTASLETKTKWIHFIVDPVDWVMFKELSDVGKSKFIDQFFSDKDPTPGDGKNEYLDKVLYHF
ncbi:MAG: hypothetical protein GY865_16660, partial [candidate division Zixibacteria bacterium]|nr:hypothetical protein [candidate division Zixibacteria bacterium]